MRKLEKFAPFAIPSVEASGAAGTFVKRLRNLARHECRGLLENLECVDEPHSTSTLQTHFLQIALTYSAQSITVPAHGEESLFARQTCGMQTRAEKHS